MLTKFAVTNFRGFRGRIEWELSSPSSYAYNTRAVRDGVVRAGVIYGPNGSGKTGLGLAVFDIVNHLTQKHQKRDYYANFANAGNPGGLVEFEYTFSLGGVEVRYDYAKAAGGRLVNERLRAADEEVFRREGSALSVTGGGFPVGKERLRALAENANGASVLNYLLATFPLPGGHYMNRLRGFVEGMLWFRSVDVREFIGLVEGDFPLDEYIIRHGLATDFAEFLATVSGQRFSFVAPSGDDKLLYCDFGGQRAAFSAVASTGTRTLELLYCWMRQMGGATFVFIDEFDAFYHFELSAEVCRRLSELDCQVFMTSHNASLISNEILRPDAYFLMDGASIRPFSHCTDKELREAHNLEKIYRAGGFRV